VDDPGGRGPGCRFREEIFDISGNAGVEVQTGADDDGVAVMFCGGA